MDYWMMLGFLGQGLFGSRFVVQWISSERKKRSVMPVYFWYLSIGGAALLLAYSIHIQDPVYIVGQSFGFLIYGRNLYFIRKQRAETSVEE